MDITALNCFTPVDMNNTQSSSNEYQFILVLSENIAEEFTNISLDISLKDKRGDPYRFTWTIVKL